MATGLTDQDRKRIEDALDHSVSANTRRSYASVWRSFEKWTQANGVPSLPAPPELVAAYLLELVKEREVSVATVQLHKAAGHELMEARDDRRLLNLQRQLARLRLLIIDELGFVPLSTTGAELLFEVFSQRYERGSILVTTNLPFDEWTDVFGSERCPHCLNKNVTLRK